MEPIIGYQLGNNFALEAPINSQFITYIKQQYGAYLSRNKKIWILPNTNYQRILNDNYLKNVVIKKNRTPNKSTKQYPSNPGSLMSPGYKSPKFRSQDNLREYSPSRTTDQGLIQKETSRQYYSSRPASPKSSVIHTAHSPSRNLNSQRYSFQNRPYKKQREQPQITRQWRIVSEDKESQLLDKISIFPIGIVELDRQIILEAKISDLINMYNVSHYFTDLLDDPYTFLIFKNKYPFTVMTSFQDFLTLNDELKTTIKRPGKSVYHPEIYLPGDRLYTGLYDVNTNNYKVMTVASNDELYLYKVDMLGVPSENILIKATGAYPYVEENGKHRQLFRGIIKHQLGPEITSIDSPFLLYKTNPLNPNFHILRSKYPFEENYKANLHVGLVSTVEYEDINGNVRFPYVINDLYDDNVILKYIGIGENSDIFRSRGQPLMLHITYIHESHTWYSPEYGKIILTPGDWRENLVNLMSIYG
jgi:hypothetical protein